MILKTQFVYAVIAILGSGLFVMGQQHSPIDRMEANDKRTAKQQRDGQDNDPFNTKLYEDLRRKFAKSGVERIASAKKRIPPTIADTSRYSEFLKQPKTGIVTLLNGSDCIQRDEGGGLVLDSTCPQLVLPGGGGHYSFRRNEYAHESLADLGLRADHLVSFGKLNQAILVDIGVANIESVRDDHPALKFLYNFAPASTKDDAAKEFAKFEIGIDSAGYVYRNSLPVKANSTFAVRVIAYKGKVRQVIDVFGDRRKIDILNGDLRKDVIVLFRVIAKEPDGSVTVIWKEIRRKDSPKLKV